MPPKEDGAAALIKQLMDVTVAPDDLEAWEEFYRSLWPAVFTIQYRHCGGNREDAQDLCQDTLIYLLKRIGPRGRPESRNPVPSLDPQYFHLWLHQICRQRYIDFLRARLARPCSAVVDQRSAGGRNLDQIQGNSVSPERIAAGREAVRKLSESVLASKGFSGPEKDLFRSLLNGLSLTEIADSREELKNLYVRFHRLRQKLRRT